MTTILQKGNFPMLCPLCQKPSHEKFSPFCSRFCQNKDLLKWLKEDYRIPAANLPDEDAGPLTDSSEEDQD